MSESSVFLSLKDDFSKALNSINNAMHGFNKNVERAQRTIDVVSKEIDAQNQVLVENQRELHKAQEELKKLKKDAQKAGETVNSKDFDEAQAKVNKYAAQVAAAKDNIKQYTKEANEAQATIRRGGAPAGGVTNKSLIGGLQKSEIGRIAGQALSDFSSYFVSSAFGDSTGNTIGSTISGMASGAAAGAMIGSVAPVVGAVVGAIVGGLSGLVSGAAQNFEKKDEYFKNAVQESYEGFKQNREEMVTSGSSVAAGREVDELAFNKLLGEGTGTAYLKDLRDLAAHTPLEYDQLTEISRQLAIGFGDESDRMLELIEVVGDAGSAVGLDSSGMVTIATALSRMQSSDKVTLEYLNLIQERGIDAIGLIGQAKGLTTAQVYDAISKGQLDGSDVVDILQTGMGEKYGGSMQEQSQTATGLQSTLSDQETERQNLTGEKYNEGRTESWKQEIAFNDSEIGQKVAWVDSLFGSVQATAENKQKQFEQEALTFLHSGEGLGDEWNAQAADELGGLHEQYVVAYQKFLTTSGEDRNLAAAEMKNIQDTARGLAESAYTMSDYYQALGELDKDFIDGIQMAEANGYYELGYEIGQQLSKGIRAAVGGPLYVEDASRDRDNGIPDNNSQASAYRRRAYGLDRVPYNGYLASLHEGERVLTAQQARQMDAAGGHAGGVVITGNSFTVREDADIGRIASELVRQMRSAKMVYAG